MRNIENRNSDVERRKAKGRASSIEHRAFSILHASAGQLKDKGCPFEEDPEETPEYGIPRTITNSCTTPLTATPSTCYYVYGKARGTRQNDVQNSETRGPIEEVLGIR